MSEQEPTDPSRARPSVEGLERLIAEGRASAAEGDLLALPELPQQSPSLSEILGEMRADER